MFLGNGSIDEPNGAPTNFSWLSPFLVKSSTTDHSGQIFLVSLMCFGSLPTFILTLLIKIIISGFKMYSELKCSNFMFLYFSIKAIENSKLNCASFAVLGLWKVRFEATIGGTVQIILSIFSTGISFLITVFLSKFFLWKKYLLSKKNYINCTTTGLLRTRELYLRKTRQL